MSIWKSWLTGAVALGVAMGCTQELPQAPSDASLAKGGKPGKPGADTEVNLIEYWIENGNMIHIKGEGDVDEVNPTVVHDYFFNGIRDDNFSRHYEYFHVGPPLTPVTQLGNGEFSVEIPWNGERSGPGDLFRDFFVTDVGGTGADPFTFALYFGKNGELVDGIQPQGVIIDGETIGPEVGNVASYALFQGDPPDGRVWVTALELNDADCAIRSRKGERVTRVTGRVYATVVTGDPESPVPASSWVEFHITDGTNLTERHSYGASDPNRGVIDAPITVEFSGSVSSITVRLLADYVYPTRESADRAYDPDRNVVETIWPGPATSVYGDVPAALSQPYMLNCSGAK